jgi:hypothetical protein
MNTCKENRATIFDIAVNNNISLKKYIIEEDVGEIINDIFEIAVRTGEKKIKNSEKLEKSLKKQKKRRDPCIVCDSSKHSFHLNNCVYYNDIAGVIYTILRGEVTISSGCEIISANDKKHIKGYYAILKRHIQHHIYLKDKFSFPVIKDSISKTSRSTLLNYCISMYTYLKTDGSICDVKKIIL